MGERRMSDHPPITEAVDKEAVGKKNTTDQQQHLLQHKKLDFFNVHNNEIANRLAKIKNIQNLFSFEERQVNTLISLAWSSNKLSDPVGLTYGEILEILVKEHLYYLYGTNEYLRSLLNILIQPNIDILELAPHNTRFSLTGFGMAYYWASDGRYI